MGGGDLNLKKSWHPSTLRNIERVWKAEQKHEVEKLKIEQLQKELADERAREEIQTFAEDQGVVKKKEQRLDWMYQGPAAMVNRDDYLLGKKIDKTLETLQQQESGKVPEKNEDERFETIFTEGSSGNTTVDLANKIREDPLFNIMKKEKEQRKNLLTNPVKMKQLQQMLQMSLSSEKKSKKDKKKKKHNRDSHKEDREKKKKRKYASESSESESEDDNYIQRKHRSKKYFSEEIEEKIERSRERTHKSHHSSNSFSQQKKEYGLVSGRNHSPERTNSYHRPEPKSDRNHQSRSSHSSSKRYEEKSSKNEVKRKLNAEEKERLLREMQDNAKWRDDQRNRNTKRYQEEAEKEDNFKRVDAADFLRPMLSKAAGNGSLESRVKQKVFTIQRNQSDMDKHFARR